MSSHYYTTACQRQRNIADATFVSLLIRLEVKATDVANRHSTTSLPEQGRRCATITFTPTSKIKLWPNPKPSLRGEGDWPWPFATPLPFALYRGSCELMSEPHHIKDGVVMVAKDPSLLSFQREGRANDTCISLLARQEVEVAGHGQLLVHYFPLSLQRCPKAMFHTTPARQR